MKYSLLVLLFLIFSCNNGNSKLVDDKKIEETSIVYLVELAKKEHRLNPYWAHILKLQLAGFKVPIDSCFVDVREYRKFNEYVDVIVLRFSKSETFYNDFLLTVLEKKRICATMHVGERKKDDELNYISYKFYNDNMIILLNHTTTSDGVDSITSGSDYKLMEHGGVEYIYIKEHHVNSK